MITDARGVLFYNRGTRFLPRLAVALRSLRRHYDGPVSVIADGGIPKNLSWFFEIFHAYRVKVHEVPLASDYVLVTKSGLWRHSPFEETLFLDADVVVRGPVEPLFDLLKEHGFVVTNFNGWKTNGRKISRRINDWSKLDGKRVKRAFDVPYAINTGVFAWRKGHPLLPATEDLSKRGIAARCGKVTLDELAMQLLLPEYPHSVAGQEWNTGAVHGDGKSAIIVHYHGDKHVRDTANCELWKQEFDGLLKDFPKFSDALESGMGDGRLAEWRATFRGMRPDITIVTAVNPEYAPKLKANLEKWMRTDGIKQQRFVVFVNGFKSAKERAFLRHPNIKVVRWDYPHGNRRERMLAAFVLGVARHVKTDYWMKLDGDTEPIVPAFPWPDYRKFTVVSHKWGYTKIKGEDGATGHWFNRLDAAFSPNAPLFKREFDVNKDKRVSHRRHAPDGLPMRYASFCHIEKTEFTRRIAGVINAQGGRLPIPSQDTMSWYCATLWREKVKLVNMKEYFRP